jgi:hypothetical protein
VLVNLTLYNLFILLNIGLFERKDVSCYSYYHLQMAIYQDTSETWVHAVAQWLRHCATNRKVAGSIPDGVIGIFH